MGTKGPERMRRKSWRRTSEKICAANAFPPGFRIVLIGNNGRARRDDLQIRSGDFAAYPADFPVWLFLEELLRNELRDAQLDSRKVELRDQRDEPLDPDLTLREVRDLAGRAGQFAEARDAAEEVVDEILGEIEDALSAFEHDPRLEVIPERDILLKALMRYVVSKFDEDAVRRALQSDEVARQPAS